MKWMLSTQSLLGFQKYPLPPRGQGLDEQNGERSRAYGDSRTAHAEGDPVCGVLFSDVDEHEEEIVRALRWLLTGVAPQGDSFGEGGTGSKGGQMFTLDAQDKTVGSSR